MTDIILMVFKKQIENIDYKYKEMLVWDPDNARDIDGLKMEKDIKVDHDALQFRDVNLHKITRRLVKGKWSTRSIYKGMKITL